MERSLLGRLHGLANIIKAVGAAAITHCHLMDLGTQGAEQCQALQIDVSWINNKVAGTQG